MVKMTLTALPRVAKTHWKRIVIGGVLLVALVAAGYYFAFVQLYKSDYAHMLNGVNSSTTSYNDLLGARDEAMAALGGDDAAFKSATDKYRQSYTKYADGVDALNQKRALRDQSVRTSYDALVARNDKFYSFVADQLALLPLVHGVTVSCSETAPSKLNIADLGGVVTAYDAAFKPCTDAMKALAASKNIAAAKLASENVAYFDAMRAHAVAMQDAYGASDRAKFESEYNALLEALAQYKTHIQVRDTLAIDKNLVPTNELNSLAKILSERQK